MEEQEAHEDVVLIGLYGTCANLIFLIHLILGRTTSLDGKHAIYHHTLSRFDYTPGFNALLLLRFFCYLWYSDSEHLFIGLYSMHLNVLLTLYK